jgi:hypothetical protein
MKRNLFRSCTLIGAVGVLGVLASCGENPTTSPRLPSPLAPAGGPNEAKFDGLNGESGNCLAKDAWLAGHTTGVNDSLDLAKQTSSGFTSCTANDISIAGATIPPGAMISLDGGTNFIPYSPPIACTKGQTIIIDVSVDLAETAESARSDIGVWIGLDGSNARTGQCNHYNLITAANRILDGKSPFPGVEDSDSDNCGDMNSKSQTSGGAVQLGQIPVKCEAGPGGTTVHVGSCLTWNTPGQDEFCPAGAVEDPNGYRFGTTPGSTSKCNCSGFDVPIEIGGSIKIIKNTVGGDGIFSFTNDIGTKSVPTADSPFSLTTVSGTDNLVMPNVRPGTYHVTESGPPAGWDFTSLVCTGNGTGGTTSTTSTQTATIVLPQGGGDVVCTFTNTKQPSTLIIKKVSNSGVGQFDFTSASAALPSPAVSGAFSLTTVTAGVAVSKTFDVVAGTSYGVTESAKAGWTFNGRECVVTTAGDGTSSIPADGTTQPAAITVGAGATVTCTYTNTKQPGTLIIKKVSNGGVGQFDFTSASAALPSPASSGAFSLTTATAGVAVSQSFTVTPGTSYGVSESSKAGWTFNGRECVVTTAGDGTSSIPADGTTQPAAITVGAGATVTCTYTNTLQPGSLIIKKVTAGGVGTFDFTSESAALPTPAVSGAFQLTTATAGTAVSKTFAVVPGTSYGVTESAKSGWRFDGRACVVTTAGDGTSSIPADGTTQPAAITVGAGATVTCTYTNSKLAKLTIVKTVKGTGAPFTFNLTGTDLPATLTLTPGNDASASHQYTDLVPGTYTATEVVPSGYKLTDLSCSDQGVGVVIDPAVTQTLSTTLALGSDVTCTFINETSVGQTTRTQGFWATHYSLTVAMWDNQALCAGGSVVGDPEVFGGFWSNISKTSTGKARSKLDQARMQLLQQLLAAILNNKAFGSSPTGSISINDAKLAFCGTDIKAISAAQGAMGSFNSSGDSGVFTPGASANPKAAKAAANYVFWDHLLP